jgi:plasmid maintenance system antidote protein VapI
MSKIRDIILKQMLNSGLTIYRVSKIVEDEVPQRTIYDFLSGKTDTTAEVVWRLLEALGLTITTKQRTFLERTKDMVEKYNQVKTFVNNDDGYLRWLRKNPTGFVLNSFRQPSSEYLILHHATCGTISTDKRTNWTTTGFIKICSLEIEELEKWAQNQVGGKLHHCKICKP